MVLKPAASPILPGTYNEDLPTVIFRPTASAPDLPSCMYPTPAISGVWYGESAQNAQVGKTHPISLASRQSMASELRPKLVRSYMSWWRLIQAWRGPGLQGTGMKGKREEWDSWGKLWISEIGRRYLTGTKWVIGPLQHTPSSPLLCLIFLFFSQLPDQKRPAGLRQPQRGLGPTAH